MAVTSKDKKDNAVPVPEFRTQYTANEGPKTEYFDMPSETVPEQGLTVKEIIARYVRTGVMPVALHDDQGGNQAFEPGFDPLDTSPEAVKKYLDSHKEKEVDTSSPVPESKLQEPSEV